MRKTVALSDGVAQQIVGRERNQRACRRQLVRDVVVARRVNSTGGRLEEFRGRQRFE